MKLTHHVHDNAFKAGMKNKAVATEMLSVYVPKEVVELVDFESLNTTDKSYVDDELKESHSDMLYEAKIANKRAYIYFLCEHQSSPDIRMPARLLGYMSNIIQDHLDKGYKTYPLILPLLVYNGERKPYPYSAAFEDYFDLPEFAKNYMLSGFQLVDLSVIPDENILKCRWSALMQMLLKYHRHKDLLDKILMLAQSGAIDFLIHQGAGRHVKKMVMYVLNSKQVGNKELAVDIMSKSSEDLGNMGLSVLEQERLAGYQEGIEKGIVEGLEQGRKQGQIQMIAAMIKQDLSDQQMQDILGVTIEELAALKRQIN